MLMRMTCLRAVFLRTTFSRVVRLKIIRNINEITNTFSHINFGTVKTIEYRKLAKDQPIIYAEAKLDVQKTSFNIFLF